MGTPELARQVHPSRGPSDDAVLIAEANAVGLVSDREVREDQVRIRSVSPRSTVAALIVRGHVIGYAKRPAPEVTGSRRLAHERATMAQLSSLDLVPQPMPQIHSVHRHLTTLWMSALPGSRLDQQTGTMPCLADVAQAWGLALARLHTERAVRPRTAAPRPWVLRAVTSPPTGPGAGSPSAAAVRRLVASDSSLRRAARQADDRWGETGWIHGDLDAGHVIVATEPEVRVRFADVGAAGAGDPCWDVVSALESLAWQAEVWGVSERVLDDYFLRGYRRGAGPGRVDPELRALRAVEVAWRIASAEDPSTATGVGNQVVRWLDRAKACAGRTGLLGWAA